jgi:hypothetical protein
MDKFALSSRMKRLNIWLDSQWQPAGVVRRQYAGAPFGDAYITIDSGRQAPQASFNHNRVHLCGAEPGLRPEGLQQLIGTFQAAGVRRFFVWLSPGPEMDVVRDWLKAAGLSPNPWVTYPTLTRDSNPPAVFRTDLDIREVNADQVAAARAELGEFMWPEYLRSVGKDDCFHFMAFDGDRPVATGELCVFEEIGYLTNGSTKENDRGRGAQQALIARRISKATEVGCKMLVTETLSLLEQLLRNLQRAGFRTVYEKEVYVWNAEAETVSAARGPAS